jgi:hypothetical protein
MLKIRYRQQFKANKSIERLSETRLIVHRRKVMQASSLTKLKKEIWRNVLSVVASSMREPMRNT